ncbi:hypothetical protein GM3709_684 [Geminocystis sp. NIES-3709]|nr:hypothetical protein GM3709_684 [Geminocystis sp. NIES-3709]
MGNGSVSGFLLSSADTGRINKLSSNRIVINSLIMGINQ